MSQHVVCLHGLRRTSADWTGVRAALPATWNTEAPELPADPAAALAAMDRLIAPGDIVFAHSLSAVTVTRLLRRRPRTLQALVLTGSFFPPARNGRTVAATLADYAQHRLALATELRIRTPTSPRSQRSVRALTSLARSALGRAPAPLHLSAPVLVIHARDDHHVPVDFAIAAARQQPDWQLIIAQSGGHHLHAEHPTGWLKLVMPWLTEPGHTDAN